MKLTLELNNYEEMQMHSKCLDAFRALDQLDTDFYNAKVPYKYDAEEHDSYICQGISIAYQTYRDVMEQYGLDGVYRDDTDE